MGLQAAWVVVVEMVEMEILTVVGTFPVGQAGKHNSVRNNNTKYNKTSAAHTLYYKKFKSLFITIAQNFYNFSFK